MSSMRRLATCPRSSDVHGLDPVPAAKVLTTAIASVFCDRTQVSALAASQSEAACQVSQRAARTLTAMSEILF